MSGKSMATLLVTGVQVEALDDLVTSAGWAAQTFVTGTSHRQCNYN